MMFRARLSDKAAILKALMTTVATLGSMTRRGSRKNARAMEPLENRLLLASSPIGAVEVFTNNTISGYAFNADSGPVALSVKITIDGVVTTVTADQPSPAHDADLGSPNHGFTYAIPDLAPGKHKVTVAIVTPSTQKLKIIKTGTLTNPAPKGTVTTNIVPSSATIDGFATEVDAAGPLTIRVDNNGATMGTTTTDGNDDFSFTVPGGTTLGVVDVYALDTPTGTPVLIYSNNKPAKGGASIKRTTVTGKAVDPDNPADTLQVEIRVDGVVVGTATADQPVTGVPGIPGTSNHGFSFTMPALSPGKHTVEVYALDPKTSSATAVRVAKAFVTNPPPTGKISSATVSGVTGTASDRDTGANPLELEVRVDGNVVATGQTTGRNFNIAYGPLSGDPHKIEVYATDADSGEKVKIGEKIINNLLPQGAIQFASPSLVSGYALDPNDPGTAVPVIFLLDGAEYPQVTADDPNANVPPGVGSNHGFSTVMPTTLPGRHTLKIVVVDTFTGERRVVATKTFSNRAPTGRVTTFTTARIAGYTYDADSPATALDVLIQIKSLSGALLTQQLVAADKPVTNRLPTAAGQNHGFDVSLAGSIAAGKYRFEIYGVDPATGVTKKLASKILTFA